MSHRSEAQVEATRVDVQSADGTTLAVWVEGDGPPLVLVHGSFRDHTTFGPLVGELRHGVTTFAMDRRGFGASGDAPDYAVEREFEDVAAVVDVVATRTGRPVALMGHSYGANCAMGGAALTGNVDRLVLYEPSLGISYPPGSIDTVEAEIAAGNVEAAVIAVLISILEMSQDDVDAMRSTPEWPTLLAAGPTVARECRVEDGWIDAPGQFDRITAPTLLLAGSESPSMVGAATDRAAAAIADSRVRVLVGHDHFAHKTDPAAVAAIVRQFMGAGAVGR